MSPAEVMAVVSGAATIVLAVTWRAAARRRSRDLLRLALADPDPETRRAAVHMVSEVGLARHADVLLEHVRREQDQGMLDAMAEAVARNQWEPSDQPKVFELRVWAHRRLEAPPSRSTTSGPLEPVEEGPGIAEPDAHPTGATQPAHSCAPSTSTQTARLVEPDARSARPRPSVPVEPAEPAEPAEPPEPAEPNVPVTVPALARPELAAHLGSPAIEVARSRSLVAYPAGHVVRSQAPGDVTWMRWVMLAGMWLLWRVFARRGQGRRSRWG